MSFNFHPFKVSINVVPDVDAPSELDTHNVMQWGQFVDHDITHTPLFRCSINLRCYVDICDFLMDQPERRGMNRLMLGNIHTFFSAIHVN